MNVEDYLTPRAAATEPVEIRKVVDLIRGRDVVPLAAGWPNPESFPVEALDEIVRTGLQEHGGTMLQYGGTRGNPALRSAIADRLAATADIDATAEEILVTAGSQQGLYLLSRALVEDGDSIAVGAPTYVAALTAFTSLIDPDIVSVPLDEEGLDLDRLETRVRDTPVEFVYVVPTFQNPTGITMSVARRERLVELAHEHDFLVIEDQPYAELSYGESPPRPIASLDRERVIYLGTFSKVLAPGLRIGWVLAPPELIDTLELLKQPVDITTSSFSQYVAERYLQSGAIDEQLRATIELYERKRDVVLEALAETMPPDVDWTAPSGGMFVWLTLPDGIDATAMLPDAVEEGVAYIPGSAFYANEPRDDTLRLNFTFAADDELGAGVRALARTIEGYR